MLIATAIGSFARTSLVSLCVLFLLYFIYSVGKRTKIVLACLIGGAILLNTVPDSWKERMRAIETHQQDASASSRISVWLWTLDFAEETPSGGGFGSYRANSISVLGQIEKGRAYHSIYFEVLGEHGYLGVGIFLMIYLLSLKRARSLYLTTRNNPDEEWFPELSKAIFLALSMFMVGGAFIGIAFQPFGYFFVAMVLCIGNFYDRSISLNRS